MSRIERNRRYARARPGLSRALVVFSTLCLTAAAAVLASSSLTAAQNEPETRRVTIEPYGIHVDYRASDENVARAVVAVLEESVPRIARQLGLERVEPVSVLLVPDIAEFEERTGVRLPSWGVAFAFPGNGFVLVDVERATNAWNSLEKVIPHELSHVLLAQRAPGVAIPLWFIEGLAQWQAGEWSILESWRLMESVWNNSAPRLESIVASLPPDERRTREAYRVSYAAFQHLFDDRMNRLPEFLLAIGTRGDFREAFASYWHEGEDEFYARFDRHLELKYKTGLMLFQPGPLFTIISVLFVLVVVVTWMRNRRKMSGMAEAEERWQDRTGH